MTKPRKELVHLESTPFYHCTVRCVRKAFLCGEDFDSGVNYDHRKQWLVSRIKFLSYVYAIDICAYAVLSNHYHVVLHVDKELALSWSLEEVAERWLQLYSGDRLVDRWLHAPGTIGVAEMEKVTESIEKWRERLYDIGWFMRGVNEKIARMANEEERSHGRFWEGRYKSQALLDEAALLSCMVYVDLNPVRAGLADDLVSSDFTSIQARLYDFVKIKAEKAGTEKADTEKGLADRIDQQEALLTQNHFNPNSTEISSVDGEQGPGQDQLVQASTQFEAPEQLKAPEQFRSNENIRHKAEEKQFSPDIKPQALLMPFSGSAQTEIATALPFTREDYFQLVDITGRAIRENKRGYISHDVAAIVARVGIAPDKWLEHVTHFGRHYGYCAGSADNLVEFAEYFQRKWAKGVGKVSKAYAA